MTVNAANTVVGARRAAGLSVPHAAADPLGFSPRRNRSRWFTVFSEK